jgi:hypothetical protein
LRLNTDTEFALTNSPEAASTAKAGPIEAARDNALTILETRHGKATNCKRDRDCATQARQATKAGQTIPGHRFFGGRNAPLAGTKHGRWGLGNG